jgi:hypothetical protein
MFPDADADADPGTTELAPLSSDFRAFFAPRGVHCTKLVRIHVSAQEGY